MFCFAGAFLIDIYPISLNVGWRVIRAPTDTFLVSYFLAKNVQKLTNFDVGSNARFKAHGYFSRVILMDIPTEHHQVHHQAHHQVHDMTIRQIFSYFMAKNVQKFDVSGNARF